VVLGRDELLQVAEVVERERQPGWVARIPVLTRRRVVEQADAPPPARLEGQHAARRGDLEEEVHRALAAVPGEEAAHHRLGDAAEAPLIAWT
jgi:hypothetical protein